MRRTHILTLLAGLTLSLNLVACATVSTFRADCEEVRDWRGDRGTFYSASLGCVPPSRESAAVPDGGPEDTLAVEADPKLSMAAR